MLPTALRDQVFDRLSVQTTRYVEAVLVEDRIDRARKEAISAVLSQINDCSYCEDMLVSLVYASADDQLAAQVSHKDAAPVGQARIVVGMYPVVKETRMLRVLRVERLEKRSGSSLMDELFLVRRSRRHLRQREERSSSHVIRGRPARSVPRAWGRCRSPD